MTNTCQASCKRCDYVVRGCFKITCHGRDFPNACPRCGNLTAPALNASRDAEFSMNKTQREDVMSFSTQLLGTQPQTREEREREAAVASSLCGSAFDMVTALKSRE